MGELRECPFCGGEAKRYDYIDGRGREMFGVTCTGERCDMEVVSLGFSQDEADRVWNHRFADAPIPYTVTEAGKAAALVVVDDATGAEAVLCETHGPYWHKGCADCLADMDALAQMGPPDCPRCDYECVCTNNKRLFPGVG